LLYRSVLFSKEKPANNIPANDVKYCPTGEDAVKKRKTGWYIFGAILLLICLGLFWQRDNIRAGLLFLRYSKDDLNTKIAENNALVDEAISKIPEISIRPLTDEERRMLQEGIISEEDAMDILLGDPGTSPPPQNENQTDDPGGPDDLPAPTEEHKDVSPAPSQDDRKAKYARIAELIAGIYVMRDSYISKLENIKTAALTEYNALPENERTESKKRALMLQCISQASKLEAESDEKMDGILSELSSLLKEVGGDMSIVSDIKAAYAEEKALKKAYYMNLYK